VVSVLNADGHVSELRCSLPILVLDHSLLTEARLASNETRRVCFGLEGTPTSVEQIVLPSYDNHILDRVANSFFPSGAIRAPNPWIVQGISVAQSEEASTTALDYVNSELMVSFSQSFRDVHRPNRPPTSGQSSIGDNRHQSQAEMLQTMPLLPGNFPNSNSTTAPRNTCRFLKPFMSLSASRNNSRNSTQIPHNSSAPSLSPLTQLPSNLSFSYSSQSRQSWQSSGAVSIPISQVVQPVPLSVAPSPQEESDLLVNAFREVPGYDIASHGCLGGGIPPMDSLRGLPSYDETEGGSASAPLDTNNGRCSSNPSTCTNTPPESTSVPHHTY
jgi:arrestin-related trafficking adapter 4/5/7